MWAPQRCQSWQCVLARWRRTCSLALLVISNFIVVFWDDTAHMQRCCHEKAYTATFYSSLYIIYGFFESPCLNSPWPICVPARAMWGIATVFIMVEPCRHDDRWWRDFSALPHHLTLLPGKLWESTKVFGESQLQRTPLTKAISKAPLVSFCWPYLLDGLRPEDIVATAFKMQVQSRRK